MEDEIKVKKLVKKAPAKDKSVSRASTAKKIKDLTTFSGEVGLFELSKQLKKGAVGTNFIVVARVKPKSGLKNTLVWLANSSGDITFPEPVKEFRSDDITDAINQLGYKLV